MEQQGDNQGDRGCPDQGEQLTVGARDNPMAESSGRKGLPYAIPHRISVRFSACRVAGFIKKGWSPDEKYLLEDQDGRRFLLRISRSVGAVRRAETAYAMLAASFGGVRVPEPVETGSLADGSTFVLQTWLEGIPLDDVLSGMDVSSQRTIGEEAGGILKSIHAGSFTKPEHDWSYRMLRKLERHIKAYSESGLSLPWTEPALSCINDNLGLLTGRPSLPQHGDYHPGNMILGRDGRLGIVDFDRCDFGDPFEEFHRAAVFARPLSVNFVNGQIRSYFDGEPEDVFWRLLKLYLADIVMYSPIWAMPFGKDQVDIMMEYSKSVVEDFGGFKLDRPVWYEP